MYVKLPRGAGRWTIVEAQQVDTDGVLYQMPNPPKAGPGEISGLDIPGILREKDVELRQHVMVLDVAGLFVEEGSPLHCDYVKVVHVLEPDGETWWTYIFQGFGYVLGEGGQTIDRL